MSTENVKSDPGEAAADALDAEFGFTPGELRVAPFKSGVILLHNGYELCDLWLGATGETVGPTARLFAASKRMFSLIHRLAEQGDPEAQAIVNEVRG